ncbi:NADAR family protein [Magnetococcus sp. PR-3]|uniref:NADAR family protein n=1 Tax=Magnetococcus sp. PR-3 TaxID=3120355 RepID=UPI002FCE0562
MGSPLPNIWYSCFSNFSDHPFELDDQLWFTVEHYFQAAKFENREQQARIYQCPSPMTAALMGKDRSVPIRPDWEKVKREVMDRAINAKFDTHTQLDEFLQETTPYPLVNYTAFDPFWGQDKQGKGQNQLGQLLMERRSRML